MAIITSALKDHFKANLSIRFDIDENKKIPDDYPSSEENRKLELKNLMENSPRIQQLLDRVDGQIIGVKKKENI